MSEPEVWQLRYFQTSGGSVPFREWREALTDHRAGLAVRARLERLRYGLFGDCRPIGEGVWEFRIDVGPGYRGYFCRAGREVILLLCGGDKATQAADIERAKEYRRDYEKRSRAAVGPR